MKMAKNNAKLGKPKYFPKKVVLKIQRIYKGPIFKKKREKEKKRRFPGYEWLKFPK